MGVDALRMAQKKTMARKRKIDKQWATIHACAGIWSCTNKIKPVKQHVLEKSQRKKHGMAN